MFKRTSKVLFMLLLVSLFVAACGANGATQPTLPAAKGPAQPTLPVSNGKAQPTQFVANNQTQPTLPAANGQAQPTLPVSGGENGAPAAGGENGAPAAGGEAGGGLSLTNPGNLPAAPSTGANDNSQSGQEPMVKINDPAGLFSILFVNTWAQTTGSTPGSLRSSLTDQYAEAEVISAPGQTPVQAAQALDASHANGAAGYQKLLIQNGNVHGLPAVSLIYQYESGTNPVTGKALKFIASQIFIGGGPADKLAHITFSAPYVYYGDASGIFDSVLAGFTWK